jgi:RNA polymerase sigma factor (sigma-70 family)
VLVRRYDKLVYNIALRSGLFADDAADVSQIVFVTIYRNLHLLERAASLSSWISVIARREAWRAKRRLTSSPTSSDSDAMESAAATAAVDSLPDEEVDRLERRFLVHRALERLDDRGCSKDAGGSAMRRPSRALKTVPSLRGSLRNSAAREAFG